MAKLTKDESKRHKQVMDMVHSDKPLSFDDKLFIIEHYQESSGQLNSLAGAFFTPWGLARDFAIEVPGEASIVDLCAGIGGLSFAALTMRNPSSITCIELNADYIEVGKRVVPEATWIHGDALQFCETMGTRLFDVAISNPPFGKIRTSDINSLSYTGGDFEYKLIESAMKIAGLGVFIIPQMSAPFKYSGERMYTKLEDGKFKKFTDQTGIVMQPNCGIDTAYYKNEWKGVSPICEIVICEV